jgi:hypothetical protein
MKDNLNVFKWKTTSIFSNGRQPQFCSWQHMELKFGHPNFFEDGRQPQIFDNGRRPQIFKNERRPHSF